MNVRAAIRSSAALRVSRQMPVVAMAAAGAAVVLVDGLTKALALYHVPELEAMPDGLVALGVVLNTGLAWGIGGATNAALVTAVGLVAILALAPAIAAPLAAHDRTSSLMLGLIAGAAVANGIDAFSSPAGVVDWIVLGAGAGVAFNLADVAVLAGLALAARTVRRLWKKDCGVRAAD